MEKRNGYYGVIIDVSPEIKNKTFKVKIIDENARVLNATASATKFNKKEFEKGIVVIYDRRTYDICHFNTDISYHKYKFLRIIYKMVHLDNLTESEIAKIQCDYDLLMIVRNLLRLSEEIRYMWCDKFIDRSTPFSSIKTCDKRGFMFYEYYALKSAK